MVDKLPLENIPLLMPVSNNTLKFLPVFTASPEIWIVVEHPWTDF
jgi:hypothetical protein